jgi:hypothetical protein
VYIETRDAEGLHRELYKKNYPFLNPGLQEHGPGRQMTLMDPASNLLRFFDRTPSSTTTG